MQRRLTNLLTIVGPPLIALIAGWREPGFTAWAHKHEAVLPLGLFLLLFSLLHARLRHLLVITLCYGVSFLAARDVFLVVNQPLPPQLTYDFVEALRPLALLIVSGLALVAAIVETFRPGTVWARRCYFGAAALYFIGTSVVNFFFNHSWQSIMLGVTGVAATFGCIFAHRIVEMEQETDEDVDNPVSDVTAQQLTEAAHLRALREKEWRDNTGRQSDQAEPSAP